MAALWNGSKCSHTTCMLRFFTDPRLALNSNLIFELGSRNSKELKRMDVLLAQYGAGNITMVVQLLELLI